MKGNPNFYKFLKREFDKGYDVSLLEDHELIRFIILNNLIRFDIDNWVCLNSFELFTLLLYFTKTNLDVSNYRYPVLLEYEVDLYTGRSTFTPYITEI